MDAEASGGEDRRDDRKRRRRKEKLRKRRCGRRSKGRRKAKKAEKPQRKLKGRPGRRPGKNPCGRNAAEKFFCWIHPILSGINGLFSLALKLRDEAHALYDNATLLWTVVLGLLCRRTPRNKMDGDMALEAKVITPWKWALTVAVVPIKPWRNDAEKQDCELKALDLMAKRLRRVFGRRGVILMGDALYACQKGMDTCRKNGWHYIFVFKEGRSSSVFREAQALMGLDRDKWGPMVGNCRDRGRTVVGGVRWANAVPFGDHIANVVECSQLVASDDAGAYYGQFITDLDVNNARRAAEIARWGRLRWVIENSFKTQKRDGEDGFGLEHTFCKDEHASRAAHMLMQLAHNLWQVFESGIVRNLSKGVSRPTQSLWARKLCDALHYYDFSEMEIVTVYLNHEYERTIPVE